MATTDNTLQLAQRHKRRRTESRATNPSSQNPDNEFCRDDRIWFEDGNIIVRAGPGCTGQGKIYGFKCHKSVLAIRSAVFETMFQLPNESGDTFDGIPTVDFPDDPADVGALLSALYGLLYACSYAYCFYPTHAISGSFLKKDARADCSFLCLALSGSP